MEKIVNSEFEIGDFIWWAHQKIHVSMVLFWDLQLSKLLHNIWRAKQNWATFYHFPNLTIISMHGRNYQICKMQILQSIFARGYCFYQKHAEKPQKIFLIFIWCSLKSHCKLALENIHCIPLQLFFWWKRYQKTPDIGDLKKWCRKHEGKKNKALEELRRNFYFSISRSWLLKSITAILPKRLYEISARLCKILWQKSKAILYNCDQKKYVKIFVYIPTNNIGKKN